MSVLVRAAEIIEETGWTQNEYKNIDTGAVCAQRAIYIAVCEENPNDDHEQRRRYTHLEAMVARRVGEATVSTWNDATDQTATRVCATLRELGKEIT